MTKKTITINRNVNQFLIEIQEKHGTICSDSALTNPAGTAKIHGSTAKRLGNGSWKCTIRWDVRPDWRTHIYDATNGKTLTFDVYQTVSHKYWLRSLIRRCR